MISSIAGDCIGRAFEFNNKLRKEYKTLFNRHSDFTDDSVLTIATADAILNNKPYGDKYLEYGLKYPDRGYGGMFSNMLSKGKLEPYNSYGNGSAMRVGPVGFAFEDPIVVLEEAKKSAECTHSHVEGIRGAQAISYAVWMNHKQKRSKSEIKLAIEEKFGYDLGKKVSDFEVDKFDVTCQGTIPLCFAIFFETNDFESAMRLSIAMGGDVDTNCCIIGSLTESFYGLPSKEIAVHVYSRLPQEMRDIVTAFTKKYINSSFNPPPIIKYQMIEEEVVLEPYIDNPITSLEI